MNKEINITAKNITEFERIQQEINKLPDEVSNTIESAHQSLSHIVLKIKNMSFEDHPKIKIVGNIDYVDVVENYVTIYVDNIKYIYDLMKKKNFTIEKVN